MAVDKLMIISIQALNCAVHCLFGIHAWYERKSKCMCACSRLRCYVPCSQAQVCYYHIPCQSSSPDHMTCQVRIRLLSNTLSPSLAPSPSLIVHQTVIAWVEEGWEREQSLFIEAKAKRRGITVLSLKLNLPSPLRSLSISISLSFSFFAHSLSLADSFIDAVRRVR